MSKDGSKTDDGKHHRKQWTERLRESALLQCGLAVLAAFLGPVATWLSGQLGLLKESDTRSQIAFSLSLTGIAIWLWYELKMSTEIAKEEVVRETSEKIDSLKANISNDIVKYAGLTQDYLQVKHESFDRHFRELLDRYCLDRFKSAVKEALSESMTFRLDELFDIVIEYIERAKEVRAVDIEVNRWEWDERQQRYFEANRRALRKGVNIRRIYVISPSVTAAQLDGLTGRPGILNTIKKHRQLNEEEDVTGTISVRGISWDDMPPVCRCKDFAIFDFGSDNEGKKVLYEVFEEETVTHHWVSKNTGAFTKARSDLNKYEPIFELAWNASEQSEADFDGWCTYVRGKIRSKAEVR